MELKTLRFFLAVAQERSITRAAAKMYISQPALTRQIQSLEDECGTPLFVRSRQGLTLTEEGLLLKSRAAELLDFADKTLSDIKGERAELAGRLAVGMGELKSSQLLCAKLAAFLKLNPKVTLEIRTANADAIRLHLERGTLDLGLLLEPADIDLYESFEVGCEEMAVLLREDDPLAVKAEISSRDLKGRAVILPSRRSLHQKLLTFFEGEMPEPLWCSNLSANAALMVKAQAALAIVAEDDYSYTGVGGLCTRPLNPRVEMRAAIVYKKAAAHSRAVQAFLNYLHAADA